MFAFTVQTFCCVIIFASSVLSAQLDDLKREYVGHIKDCVKEHPLPPSDIDQLQKKLVPDKKNAKCFLACCYKKAGMMDDQGMLSVEGLNAISKKYLSEDPDQLKKAEEFTNACKSVNEEPVSDGADGCDRAALMFKCSVDKAPEVLIIEEEQNILRNYSFGSFVPCIIWVRHSGLVSGILCIAIRSIIMN